MNDEDIKPMRELTAMLAMNALLPMAQELNPFASQHLSIDDMARIAVKAADALIAQLKKEPPA